MPNETKVEEGEVDRAYWRNTVKEAFKNDPLRVIIELLKNSADSYTRLRKKTKISPPFEIDLILNCKHKSAPSLIVKDYGEGMDSEKLKTALKYGAQTSMGEDTEATTSGEKGIGLKDSLMALEENWLITVRDGKINERNKHHDFKTGFGKIDEKITEKEMRELGISNNGTVVKGTLPDFFKERKFETICERLQKHFLLRKLLQNPDFKITAIDGHSEAKVILKYACPNIEKEMLKESFSIDYEGKKHKITLLINKTKKELTQGKPYGESGLLFFYGIYTVLDFTFSRYDRDLSFAKFFGEVKMEVESIIRDQNESPLVDEKRRGLDSEHPFNRSLFDEINKRLQKILEEEESSEYSIDDSTKKSILNQLNKIYKDIKGKGGTIEPPIKPELFEFYPVHTYLKEFESKNVNLIINPGCILGDIEITIKSSNKSIDVTPQVIKINEEDVNKEFIVKQVKIYSEEKGAKGEIIALCDTLNHSAKVGVDVTENPIFSPNNGFSFVPDKTTIVDGGQKNIDLYIDKKFLGKNKEIKLSSSDPIECAGKWILPDKKNWDKCEIKVKGNNKIGKSSIINATYEGKKAEIEITVVNEPSISGLFRDVIPSGKETKDIAKFVKEIGILEFYYKHPMIKKYMINGDFRKKPDFLAFLADTLSRTAIKAVVVCGINESSSRFPIFDQDRPEIEIDRYATKEYFENGLVMHELFLELCKSIKFGEVNN